MRVFEAQDFSSETGGGTLPDGRGSADCRLGRLWINFSTCKSRTRHPM